MSRVLFSDGVIQFRTGVQIIPEGSTADDCICCDPSDCAYCDGSGGPYSSASYSAVISGFPASFVYRGNFNPFIFTPTDVIVEGLDAANGTYALPFDSGSCSIPDLATITMPLTWRTTSWFPGPGQTTSTPACDWTGRNAEFSETVDSFLNISRLGYTISGGNIPSFWGASALSGNAAFTNGCSSDTQTSTFTRGVECEPPGTTVSINHTGTWTFTGVP